MKWACIGVIECLPRVLEDTYFIPDMAKRKMDDRLISIRAGVVALQA